MTCRGASGVYFANIVNCPISTAERGVYALNQDERHEGDYSAYNREYTTDLAAYEARETNLLGWHTTYSVDRLGVSMTVDIDGTIRYTQAIDEETTPHGDFFLSRGILTEDAPLEGNDDGTLGMFQDYQLEVYFPLNENQTVHFFTIWRDVRYTSALDFSSEFLQDIVLDGMVDWDKDTEAECREPVTFPFAEKHNVYDCRKSMQNIPHSIFQRDGDAVKLVRWHALR